MNKVKVLNISLIVHSRAEKTSGFNSCFLGREWLNFGLNEFFPSSFALTETVICFETSNDVAKDYHFGWFVASFHIHTGIRDTEKSVN